MVRRPTRSAPLAALVAGLLVLPAGAHAQTSKTTLTPGATTTGPAPATTAPAPATTPAPTTAAEAPAIPTVTTTPGTPPAAPPAQTPATVVSQPVATQADDGTEPWQWAALALAILLVAALAWGLVVASGRVRWMRPMGHAMAEAGWRIGLRWAEFRDWMRFGSGR
ncbi:hypothetical protein [Patulibacter sp. SYSU D01012]|uniref:hypothetical protein n=1 Tax=Patulibacter sp. SYSU D01012 TaxID=2817381 RepID=UPI001B310703|nr:hypothetical protein [Patulibacter sp. SYSU D01012]